MDRLCLAHADLCRRRRRTNATISQIAQSFDISKSHLMKVVNRLAQQGYLDTVRGKGGGIKLARSPAEIRVGAVVREMEQDLAVVGCLTQAGFCTIEGCCVLRQALHEATLAFLRTLDGYTLADLLAPGTRLTRSLGLTPGGWDRQPALATDPA